MILQHVSLKAALRRFEDGPTVFCRMLPEGRARRSEFWWWALFTLILGFAAGIVDAVLGTRSSSTGTGFAMSRISTTSAGP
jgi:hypothetical protein